MKKYLEHIIKKALLAEQDAPAGDAAAATPLETDNAPSDAKDSPFTPAEERFLGKFDAYGSKHLGILYSTSDAGVREFVARSGKELNVSPGILRSLFRKKIIKFVPYTGFGRNDDYTIELQLSLDDIAGLGDEDRAKIEKNADKSDSGAGVEVASFMKYGDILTESVIITKNLLQNALSEGKKSDVKIYVDKSRLLKRFPKEFIYHLRKIVNTMDKKTKNNLEKERLVADILDNLQVNLKLTPKDIRKSYEFHKNQKRLQKTLDKIK